MNVDPSTSRTEAASGWFVVAAGTCGQIPPTGRRPLVEGQQAPAADLIDVTCASDAGAATYTAACDGHIRRYMPATVHGGALVLPDGGTWDIPVDTVLGIALLDASAIVIYDGGWELSQVCCPAGGPACAFGDTFSETARLAYVIPGPADSGPVDSGGDSADAADAADASDAADAADSSDAGSPPTITSVVPNYAVAVGSPSGAITITGTNLGSALSVSFGGVAGTITGNTGTTVTATAPACTGAPLSCTAATGVNAVITVSVTTAAGTGSSNGTFPNNFWFLSSTLDGLWSAQTVTNVTGNTHVILDMSGNGFNATANGSNCPWSATGEGSGLTPYITTTTCTGYKSSFPTQDAGTSEWFSSATHLGPDGGTGFDKLVMTDNQMQLSSQGTARGLDEYNGAFANTLTFGTIGNTIFAADSLFNGASSYQQCCSGTLVNGGNPGTASAGSPFIFIGSSSVPDRPWIGRFVFLAHAPGTGVSAPARTVMQSYFNDQGLHPW